MNLNFMNIYWYQYLFAKPNEPLFCSNNYVVDWWIRLLCRIQNHPSGIIYYNPAPAEEPDYRCKNCGDIL